MSATSAMSTPSAMSAQSAMSAPNAMSAPSAKSNAGQITALWPKIFGKDLCTYAHVRSKNVHARVNVHV